MDACNPRLCWGAFVSRGRPHLAETERLGEVVRLRLSGREADHVRLTAREAGLSVSAYLRARACGYQIPHPPHRRGADPAVLNELNRIGVNLNQIARNLNSGRRNRVDLEAVIGELQGTLRRLADETFSGADGSGADSPEDERKPRDGIDRSGGR